MGLLNLKPGNVSLASGRLDIRVAFRAITGALTLPTNLMRLGTPGGMGRQMSGLFSSSVESSLALRFTAAMDDLYKGCLSVEVAALDDNCGSRFCSLG